MPQFSPSESKVAIAPITVKPAGLSAQAEMFLGPDEMTKVATSGRIPFTSTGVSQNIRVPLAMPAAEGSYHVYIDVYVEGVLIAAYQAIEDVDIMPAPVATLTNLWVNNLRDVPPGQLIDLGFTITTTHRIPEIPGQATAGIFTELVVWNEQGSVTSKSSLTPPQREPTSPYWYYIAPGTQALTYIATFPVSMRNAGIFPPTTLNWRLTVKVWDGLLQKMVGEGVGEGTVYYPG